jgi:hypothetical protein
MLVTTRPTLAEQMYARMALQRILMSRVKKRFVGRQRMRTGRLGTGTR